MSTFSFTYTRGATPQVLVELATSTGSKRAVGDVDSGSDRSLCPLVYAADLGITGADLVQFEKGGQPSVGEQFDTWQPQGVAITGQIVDPSTGNPWGPIFAMDLAFAKTDTLLLGQRDFFAAFDLLFCTRSSEPTLEIKPCARRPSGP